MRRDRLTYAVGGPPHCGEATIAEPVADNLCDDPCRHTRKAEDFSAPVREYHGKPPNVLKTWRFFAVERPG